MLAWRLVIHAVIVTCTVLIGLRAVPVTASASGASLCDGPKGEQVYTMRCFAPAAAPRVDSMLTFTPVQPSPAVTSVVKLRLSQLAASKAIGKQQAGVPKTAIAYVF